MADIGMEERRYTKSFSFIGGKPEFFQEKTPVSSRGNSSFFKEKPEFLQGKLESLW